MLPRIARLIPILLCAGAVYSAPPLKIVTPSPLPTGTMGVSYTLQLSATGGQPPYNWMVFGSLPAGLSLVSPGVITGIPQNVGTANFSIQVTDQAEQQSSGEFSLTINPPMAMSPLTITSASTLPSTQPGSGYGVNLAAAGGQPPYTWSLVSGALPAGITLANSGLVSGTPSSTGTAIFTAQVSDSSQFTTSKQFSLAVSAPVVVTTTFIAAGTVGRPYTQTLLASGGMPPYSWTIVSGAAPKGVALSTAGVLGGTPIAAGFYTFIVQATDNSAVPAAGVAIMQAPINPPPDLSGIPAPPPGIVGIPYLFAAPNAGGPAGNIGPPGNMGPPPDTIAIAAGALPPGLTLDATVGIAGTPTAAGSYSFTVLLTDPNGATGSRAFSISINATLAITTASPLPGGTAGVAYTQTLAASGGLSPITWSIVSGALPVGLAISASGVVSGTPAAASTPSFTVQAADTAGEKATRQFQIAVAQQLAISPSPLPGGNAGVNYLHTLVGSGGRLPYTWSVVSGALPTGLSLLPIGIVSGIPSAAGSYSFSVQIADAAQATASSQFSLTIAPLLTVTTPPSLPGATMARSYTQILSGSGGTPPYQWSISSGALPAGLSLGSSGAITGVPGASGVFSFTARISDSAGVAAGASLTIDVTPPPVIGTPSPLASGVTGTAYSQTIALAGGTAPYHWSIASGALPAGLSLDAGSGAIGGSPTAPGQANFTVQAQDSAGLTAVKPFALTIGQTLTVAPLALAFQAPLASRNIQVSCSTPGAPVTFSASPAWLTASPAAIRTAGAVSVSADPTGLAVGTYQGSIAAACGPTTQSVSVTLTIAPVAPTSAPAGLPALYFAFAQGASPSSQSVILAGAASSSATSSAPWLSVAPSGGAMLLATADPSGMAAGTYSAAIQIGAAPAVTVSMAISAASQALVLSQTGLTFTTVAGSTAAQSRSFGVLNTGQGSMPWTAASSTLSGGSDWLTATPLNGASDAAGQAALITVAVNPDGLDAGQYYGQIAVQAPSAGGALHLVSVVLNVFPADQSPGVQVYPNGLLFVGSAGAANPDPQKVTLTNAALAPAAYSTSAATDDGANWLALAPGSVPGGASLDIAIQPDISALGAGVWQGSIALQFDDGSTSAISVALVLRAGPAQSPSSIRPRQAGAGCSPSKLVPLFTSLGGSFNVPASWPAAIEMIVVDDCGNPLTAGSVVTTFSNGDPPLSLTALREGNWGATWTPRSVSASAVGVTGQASDPRTGLQGVARLSGGVLANPQVPVISAGGVVSSASFAADAPLAPGSLIAIFGSHLATGQLTASTLPLPNQLGDTQVLIGSQPVPLFLVSDTQISGMLPYGLALNTQHQLIVQRGTSYTTPQTITIAGADPGSFTQDLSGTGQGVVVDSNYNVVNAGNPAAAGDTVVIYTTGLGEVTPAIPAGTPAPIDSPRPTFNPVTVTMGGMDAPQVLFAGLAPGFAGLYQVQVVIPAGIAPGSSVPVVIAAAGIAGPPVTIVIQ